MMIRATTVAAALALAACQGATPSGPDGAPESRGQSPAAAATDDVVVGVRGGATTLRAGQTLTIGLPSNGSTGYAWQVGAFDETVLKRGAPFGVETSNPHPDGMVGVPGETQWRFVAGAPGSTTLEFAYGRPWETGAAPAEARFTITVR